MEKEREREIERERERERERARETARQREGPTQREISEGFFSGLSGSRLCPYRFRKALDFSPGLKVSELSAIDHSSSSNLQGESSRGGGGDPH